MTSIDDIYEGRIFLLPIKIQSMITAFRVINNCVQISEQILWYDDICLGFQRQTNGKIYLFHVH